MQKEVTWEEIFEGLNGKGWKEKLHQKMQENLANLVVGKPIE
jgi:hypothetical protein